MKKKLTVTESNQLMIEIGEKQGALEDIHKQIRDLKHQIKTLEIAKGVLESSICQYCKSNKNEDYCNIQCKEW